MRVLVVRTAFAGKYFWPNPAVRRNEKVVALATRYLVWGWYLSDMFHTYNRTSFNILVRVECRRFDAPMENYEKGLEKVA